MKAIFYSLLSILALCAAHSQPAYVRNISTMKPAAVSAPACDTSNDSELATYNTGSASAALTTTTWAAQQFSFAGNRTLTGVFVNLSDTGGDVGSVVVSLYTDDGAGKPASQIANTEVTVATSTFGASQVAVWFEFPQVYSYTASAAPHIVVKTIDSGAVNIFYGTSSLYAGGTATSSSNSGSTWNAPSSAFDYKFAVWGCE